MMDCKQLRENLDCYVDGELSEPAAAAAESHLAECPACARVASQLNSLRRQVRRAVTAHETPAGLDARVRRAIGTPILGSWAGWVGEHRTMAAAAATLVLALMGWTINANAMRVEGAVAGLLDHAVIALAPASSAPVDLEGTIVCRDCELSHQSGENVMCDRVGHRGAIATDDGRIWNIVEQPGSTDLVRDSALLGKTVRVRARLFRRAGALAVDSYRIVG